MFVLYHSPAIWKTSDLGNNLSLLNSQTDQSTALLALPSGPQVPFDEKRSITLEDDEWSHFQPVGAAPLCYTEGTDVAATLAANSSECQCRTNYFGSECGIPAAVWHRTVSKKYPRWPLKPRKVPRRIIHGLNINHEIDFFRIRLEELQVRNNTFKYEIDYLKFLMLNRMRLTSTSFASPIIQPTEMLSHFTYSTNYDRVSWSHFIPRSYTYHSTSSLNKDIKVVGLLICTCGHIWGFVV